MSELRQYRAWTKLAFILSTIFLAVSINGCGGGSDGGMVSTPEPFLEGTFVDSPVEGLEYETPTHTGMTDSDGTFLYHEGDTIRFYIGDIILGEAMAKSMMTPVDLVEGAMDETHPAVVNMARFLQTIDEDLNPENGITIPGSMENAMIGHIIDFNMPTIDFEYDPNVIMAMDAINSADMSGPFRMMVSANDARTHLRNSIDSMMQHGGYMMGSSSFEPFLEGTFVDSPVEGLEYETPTHTGITDENGTFMYHEGETIMFFVGDIILGEAMAESMMTPLNLVVGANDENHPAVINMARFLQTMDNDMNPENGITITEAMSNAMTDHMIDFNMDPYQFTYDPDVMMVMVTINEIYQSEGPRIMVSPEDAVAHLNGSMSGMMTDGGTNGRMMSSSG